MTTPAEQPDSCRLVDIDGETVRVRGSGDMDEQDQQALGQIVRAARARMKAEKEAEEAAIRADERAKVAADIEREADRCDDDPRYNGMMAAAEIARGVA